MTILLALIPIAIVLVAIAAWFFIWAVRSGQYDDLDAPAIDILREDRPNAALVEERPAGTGSDSESAGS
ncbi:cbb3-type cytochrome oxidase assembly protein CcoS [Ahniella affigens]|uniref:Cbb3-type cytochrome oxidase assembly protein CcoS n=1 Tax=Ahniella affigens TaxID=2021234 RepID=A0A2P1PP43_9GAMM|nr:cbb3-type cytochrome oxidase assembly protein CcoS [Ahniella affigens]AVP96614.1 cbb3-type cytochrome oxidase assembly protein CcoS [Ahniella affigens]